MRSLVSLAGAFSVAAPPALATAAEEEGEEEEVSTRSFSVSSLCMAASFFKMLFLVGDLAGVMEGRPAAHDAAAAAAVEVEEEEEEEAGS